MGEISEEETEARCFGCGRFHKPRTDMDLLCDRCSRRKEQEAIGK